MKTEQAISELQKFLSFKRAGEHAEDVLKKLQDAEGETKEQEKKLDKLKEENTKLAAEAAKVKGNIEDAEAKAAEIISKAEADAAGAIAAAQDNIQERQSKAEYKIAELQARILDADAAAAAAEKRAKEAHDRLAVINKEIEDAKARAQKIMGA